MRERLQALPPEQREPILQRMAARGQDPTATDGGTGQRERAPDAADSSDQAGVRREPEATTIDALFGPLPTIESTGRVWMQVDGKLTPLRVRLGITDGQVTELIEGDLEQGAELVTAVNTGTEMRPTSGGIGGFPFMTPMGRGGFQGGGNPTGGRR
jgi:hypothetical protein